MVKEYDSFLHVGFGKCASSFLETRYFTEANGFHNLYRLEKWRKFLDCQLLTSQSTYYSPVVPEIDTAKFNPGTIVGMSNGGFLGGIDYRMVLERWKMIMPTAKVLIVIRNQPEQIYSGYGQRIISGYFHKPDEHIRELIYNAQQDIWGQLFYDRVYEVTKEFYEDVLMIPVERMREFDVFLSELNSFFGVKIDIENVRVRESLNYWSIRLMRFFNQFVRHGVGLPQMSVLPSYEGGIDRFLFNRVPGKEPSNVRRRMINKLSTSIGQRLPKSDRAKVKFMEKYGPLFEEWFSESNNRLNAKLDVDLHQYGYVGVTPGSRRPDSFA